MMLCHSFYVMWFQISKPKRYLLHIITIVICISFVYIYKLLLWSDIYNNHEDLKVLSILK